MDALARQLADELAWYEPWRRYLEPLPLKEDKEEPDMFDLGARGERILDTLCICEAASPSTIAKESHVGENATYAILESFAKKGYVKRIKRGRYAITPEGRKAAVTPNPKVWEGNKEVINW